MSHEKTTLEIIAPTVEEAVAKGLNQLGLREDEVEVEVLDAGSRGSSAWEAARHAFACT